MLRQVTHTQPPICIRVPSFRSPRNETNPQAPGNLKYFSIKKDILATLAYFDLFRYPLKKKEIFSYLGHCDDFSEFEQALDHLQQEGLVYRMADFYCLEKNLELVRDRRKSNEKARGLLKKAETAARIIAAFPYVKAVAISGSLSKNCADETSDIDFFIVTSANRLWIARTLLHLFKKICFLFSLQDYFCMNYFIDEAEPEILEKNIYTAIETATLMPLCGKKTFRHFLDSNAWAKNFLPNHGFPPIPAKEINGNWIRYGIEKLLSQPFGDRLDNRLMRLTSKRWDAKTAAHQKNSKGLLMGLHTGRHFAKPDPSVFQKKIMQRYEQRLQEVFRQYA